MNKIGSFFFSFVPLALAISIQFLAMYFLMGMSALFAFPVNPGSRSADMSYEALSNFWMSNDFSTGIMIIYSLLVICIFGIWYYCTYGGEYLPKLSRIWHPLKLVAIVILVPGTQFLSTYITTFVAVLYPDLLEQYIDLIESAGLDSTPSLMLICYSIILAPIGEELIFRGVTMRSARKALPFWAANIMQAVLFGVFHMNWIQGCYAFALGLILGYVCERGGSIYYSMLLHFLFNFWGTVLSEYLTYGDTVESYYLFFALAIILTVLGVFLFKKGAARNEPRRA